MENVTNVQFNFEPNELIGRPLRDIIYCDEIHKSSKEVWLYISNIESLMAHGECYHLLGHISCNVKESFIKDIKIDNNDIDIIIENPFA